MAPYENKHVIANWGKCSGGRCDFSALHFLACKVGTMADLLGEAGCEDLNAVVLGVALCMEPGTQQVPHKW